MKSITTLLALLVCASFACAADRNKPKRPADGKRPDPDAFFKSVDKNRDGFVSKDEFMADPHAKQNPNAANNFPRLDKDKDGKLSKDEFNGTAK